MDVELEFPSIRPAPTQNSFLAFSSSSDDDNMTDISNSNLNLNLQQQAMLNQFVSIAGCSLEQAFNLLESSNWQYQDALNTFFDETSIFNNSIADNLKQNNKNCLNINYINSMSANAPSNTPVTPPNVDFLEKAFSKLNSSFQDNPTSSRQSFDNSRNFELNLNQQYNLNNNNIKINNNNSLECEMIQSNPVQMTNTSAQLPFSEKLYLESARFNYYHN